MELNDIWPIFGVRIDLGDLSLRVVRDDDIPELVALAIDGVHDAASMPFQVPWTRAEPPVLAREAAKHYWRDRAEFAPGDFALEFVVRRSGEVVGCQGFRSAPQFQISRTGETGSWLGRRFHGQGIGTRMRQAVCAFAFDHLGAEQITSGAFDDNPASLAVSRKVGYQPNGSGRFVREGKLAHEQKLVLTPATFNRPAEQLRVTGAEELVAFVGANPDE